MEKVAGADAGDLQQGILLASERWIFSMCGTAAEANNALQPRRFAARLSAGIRQLRQMPKGNSAQAL